MHDNDGTDRAIPAPAELDVPEETVRLSLGMHLRSRYWGRLLIIGVIASVLLGLADAAVPILNWQLALVAASTVILVASATRRDVVFSLLVLASAVGIHIGMLADRFDTQRCMILVYTLALLSFALYLLFSRKALLPDGAPRAFLSVADGRQVPLLLLTGGRQWIAVSANGKLYLPAGDNRVTSIGRGQVTLRVQEEPDGRRYVPDLSSFAGEI